MVEITCIDYKNVTTLFYNKFRLIIVVYIFILCVA